MSNVEVKGVVFGIVVCCGGYCNCSAMLALFRSLRVTYTTSTLHCPIFVIVLLLAMLHDVKNVRMALPHINDVPMKSHLKMGIPTITVENDMLDDNDESTSNWNYDHYQYYKNY